MKFKIAAVLFLVLLAVGWYFRGGESRLVWWFDVPLICCGIGVFVLYVGGAVSSIHTFLK